MTMVVTNNIFVVGTANQECNSVCTIYFIAAQLLLFKTENQIVLYLTI